MAINPKGANAAYLLISTLLVGCSIANSVIVDNKFWEFASTYWNWNYIVLQDDCTLGTYKNGTNLCYFNWSIAGFAGFMAVVTFFMAGCNSRRPGRATPFVICFAVLTTIWAVGAGVNTDKIPDAKDKAPSEISEPNQVEYWFSLNDYRTAVLAISWTAFFLSLIATIIAIIDIKNNKPVPPQAQFMYAGGDPNQPPYGAAAPYGAYPPGPGGYPPAGGYAAGGAPPPPPPGGYPAGYPAAGAPPPTGYPAPQQTGAPLYTPQGPVPAGGASNFTPTDYTKITTTTV